MKNFLFVLLLLSLYFAACTGEASFYVPAVVGNDGNLVGIAVKLIPGTGDIFISTEPRTGVSTQSSSDDAVFYAFKKANANLSQCDVLVRIDGKNMANYVDGPSAGAAIALTTYAAISGVPIRTDATLTGATDVFGSMLPVGGLFEKTKAAIGEGKVYIVTPQNRISDKVVLKTLKDSYNITILEAETLDQVFDFFLSGKAIEQIGIKASKRDLPDLENYTVQGLDFFKDISLKMILVENDSINSLSDSDNESAEIKEYFKSETDRQLEILARGYFFTAANEAFLDYIEIGTMVSANNLDLESKYSEVNSCLGNLKDKPMTQGNFEYLIGSKLREEWALQKLRSIKIDEPELIEEKYYTFNDMMYADAWCKISSMLRTAGNSGSQINESLWKDLASEKIKTAENLDLLADDWKGHLDNAKSLYAKGDYGAAIYDATFAISMQKTDSDARDVDKISADVVRLAVENRSSIWGKIYQTQGVFLSRSGASETKNAYRILSYAAALDNATGDMAIILLNSKTNAESNNTAESSDSGPIKSIFPLALLFIFVFAIALAYYLLKKNRSNSPVRGKKYR